MIRTIVSLTILALAFAANGQNTDSVQRKVYGAFGNAGSKVARTAGAVAGYAVRKNAQHKIDEKDARNARAIQELIAEKPLSGLRVGVQEDPSNRRYITDLHTAVPAQKLVLEMGGMVPLSRTVNRSYNDLSYCKDVHVDYCIVLGRSELVTRRGDRVDEGGSINIPLGKRKQRVTYRGGENIRTEYVSVPVMIVAFSGSEQLAIASSEADGFVRSGNTYYGVSTSGHVSLGRNGGSSTQTNARYMGYPIAVQNAIADAVNFIMQRRAELAANGQ